MKKTVSAILLTGVFAAMPAMVAAASQEEAKTEPSKEIVLNKFKDNWMISLEGGVDFDAMGGLKRASFKPNAARHKVYLELYALYKQLHDAFGTKGWSGSLANVMKDLLALKDRQRR